MTAAQSGPFADGGLDQDLEDEMAYINGLNLGRDDQVLAADHLVDAHLRGSDEVHDVPIAPIDSKQLHIMTQTDDPENATAQEQPENAHIL